MVRTWPICQHSKLARLAPIHCHFQFPATDGMAPSWNTERWNDGKIGSFSMTFGFCPNLLTEILARLWFIRVMFHKDHKRDINVSTINRFWYPLQFYSNHLPNHFPVAVAVEGRFDTNHLLGFGTNQCERCLANLSYHTPI